MSGLMQPVQKKLPGSIMQIKWQKITYEWLGDMNIHWIKWNLHSVKSLFFASWLNDWACLWLYWLFSLLAVQGSFYLLFIMKHDFLLNYSCESSFLFSTSLLKLVILEEENMADVHHNEFICRRVYINIFLSQQTRIEISGIWVGVNVLHFKALDHKSGIK